MVRLFCSAHASKIERNYKNQGWCVSRWFCSSPLLIYLRAWSGLRLLMRRWYFDELVTVMINRSRWIVKSCLSAQRVSTDVRLSYSHEFALNLSATLLQGLSRRHSVSSKEHYEPKTKPRMKPACHPFTGLNIKCIIAQASSNVYIDSKHQSDRTISMCKGDFIVLQHSVPATILKILFKLRTQDS